MALSYITIRDFDGNSVDVEVLEDASTSPSRYTQVFRQRSADGLAVSAVNVTNTATQLVAGSVSRTQFRLYNNSSVTVYLGPSGVTTATGTPLPPGQWWVEGILEGAMYAIASTAGPHEVRVLEYTNADT